MQLSVPLFQRYKTIAWDDFFQFYREEVITYAITPNNAPELDQKRSGGGRYRDKRPQYDYDEVYSNHHSSNVLLNTMAGLFSKFYLPERIRFEKNGIRIKLNDIVSYKVVFQDGNMKFYLTIPKRWAKNFTNAIRRDWGQVDISRISSEIIKFNPDKAKVMEIALRHHHALSIKYEKDENLFYPAISSLSSTLSPDDKLLLDFNIEPTDDSWKGSAKNKIKGFKNGNYPSKDEWNLRSILWRIVDFAMVMVNESLNLIQQLMIDENEKKESAEPFKLEYSEKKTFENSKGFKLQIHAIAESNDSRKTKHILKGVEGAFSTLDGDNKFVFNHIRTKRGIKTIIKAVNENKPLISKPRDIYFEKELKQLVDVPDKETLKEFKKVIQQDNFTRTEIHKDFLVNVKASNKKDKKIFTNKKDLYDYLLKQDLRKFLGVNNNGYFNCKFHEDSSQSATIEIDKKTNYPKYKCNDGSCKFTGNIFKVTEKLFKLNKSDAVDHLCNYYNVEFVDNQALPFATTLDKDSKIISFPSYEREWWEEGKGRYVEERTKLDDRSRATLVVGTQGSGKTSFLERQALTTFGVHLPKDEWKEKSKSVVLFDVADGSILANVWNAVPEWLRDRVIILNHSKPEKPIPVNFADLQEFNAKVMNNPDYASRMAQMEKDLIEDILKTESSVYTDRWFKGSLQAVHEVNPDYGIPEAIKVLIDDNFRINEIIPKVSNSRLKLELEIYSKMKASNQTNKIEETIQNRLIQLESDPQLWDCIAQKPLRDENGENLINFRKWIDGDEDGAYLVLIYIPKEGVSKTFRRFIFAHYLVKLWNVSMSRERGFAGREYRPETLVIVDELHQIIDIPIIANLFVDFFKEPRKYSIRFEFSIHGWSSLAKAGRTQQNMIKESILDNGCNLIMLKGGSDVFESLGNLLTGMTVQDFDNLMNMDFCGIYSIQWQGKTHVFQGKLLPPVWDDKSIKKYDTWNLNDLHDYISPFSRDREEVREENLERVRDMLVSSITDDAIKQKDTKIKEGRSWEDLEKGGTKDKKFHE